MKNLTKPGPAVAFIMKVTLIMMGKYKVNMQDSKVWQAGVQMMKNPKQFLELIKQYKGESIDENVKVMAKAEIKKSEANICAFTEERHKFKGCLASSKLCLWIANILEFNETYLFVKPLKAKQLQAEKEMQQKQAQLDKVMLYLKQVNEKVDKLNNDYKEANEKLVAVQTQA